MLKKISILTLFPDSFKSYLNESIIKRAIELKQIEVELINFRNYSTDPHKKVDDVSYGGGPGMVIMLQPIIDCLKQIKTKNSYVILTTPSGYTYNQQTANNLVCQYEHLIIICGHYEGIDERIYHYIDTAISIGDYVLTGGELPAMIMLDSLTRLISGVIKKESIEFESFMDDLLDYPVYTKPQNYDNYAVPAVLLSGNHKLINEYRYQQQLNKTKQYRADLYNKHIQKKKISK